MTSAKEKVGLEKLWTTVGKFQDAIGSQNLVERRAQQRVANMWTYLQVGSVSRHKIANLSGNESYIHFGFLSCPLIHFLLQEDFLRNARLTCRDVEIEVLNGNLTPAQGSRKVMEVLCDFQRSS